MRMAFFGSDQFSLGVLQAAMRHTAHEWHVFHPPGARTAFAAVPGIASATALPEGTLRHWAVPPALDVGVVASFGYFVPPRVIAAFPRGMLNAHPSMLPAYRGAAPIQRALMARDHGALGVSVIDVHPREMDAGDVWMQRRVAALSERPAFAETSALLAAAAGAMIAEIVRDEASLEEHARRRVPQGGVATWAPKIAVADFAVAFADARAAEIDAKWRAIGHVRPLAAATAAGREVSLVELDPRRAQQSMDPAQFAALAARCVPGATFYDRAAPALWIRCADGEWVGVRAARIAGTSVQRSPGDLYNVLRLRNFERHFV